jgi:hypothetical protein
MYAAKLLPDPITVSEPAKYVAVMEIINVISGNITSLVIGILCLVFYSDPEVEAYFNRQAPEAI